MQRGMVAAMSFFNYFAALFDERRAHPGDDLISALVAAEEAGDRLSPEELSSSIVVLLFIAGHETTMNLIGNGTLALLRQPDQLARWRDDPAWTRRRWRSCCASTRPRTSRGVRPPPTSRWAVQLFRKGTPVVTLIGGGQPRPRAVRWARADSIWAGPTTSTWPSPRACTTAWARRWLASRAQIALGSLVRRFPTWSWPRSRSTATTSCCVVCVSCRCRCECRHGGRPAWPTAAGRRRGGQAAWRGGRSAIDSGRSTRALLATLARLVPLARLMVRWVRFLAISAAVSVVIIVAVPLTAGWPGVAGGVALAAVALVLAGAPVVLWLFYDALEEVLALPGWLRASPDIVRLHGRELADLVLAARSAGGEGRRRRVHLVRDGWKAGRLLLETHAEVPGYGAALRLVSLPFLVAVALAVVGALVEITLAPLVVLVAIALRLL